MSEELVAYLRVPVRNYPFPPLIAVHSGGYWAFHDGGTPYTEDEMDALGDEIDARNIEIENESNEHP